MKCPTLLGLTKPATVTAIEAVLREVEARRAASPADG
jgi:hypothetical protein